METLPTIIHTGLKEVPKITPWEVEAEMRQNETASGNKYENIETLNAEDTTSKALAIVAKLYIKCLQKDDYPQR